MYQIKLFESNQNLSGKSSFFSLLSFDFIIGNNKAKRNINLIKLKLLIFGRLAFIVIFMKPTSTYLRFLLSTKHTKYCLLVERFKALIACSLNKH